MTLMIRRGDYSLPIPTPLYVRGRGTSAPRFRPLQLSELTIKPNTSNCSQGNQKFRNYLLTCHVSPMFLVLICTRSQLALRRDDSHSDQACSGHQRYDRCRGHHTVPTSAMTSVSCSVA